MYHSYIASQALFDFFTASEKTDSPIHRAASARPRELITERDALRANLDVSTPTRTYCGSSFDGLETLLHIWDRDFSPHVLSDLEDRQHPDLWALVRCNWRQESRL